MSAKLWLSRFESPLSASWQVARIATFTGAERARLERIERPLRREQFVLGHHMVRLLAQSAHVDDASLDIDRDGRLLLSAKPPAYVSIAHAMTAVAVVVASQPVGVDLESPQALRDPRAAAIHFGLPANEADPLSVLRAWVRTEARFKAGPQASAQAWESQWNDCRLAVAGLTEPPLTGVFEAMTGTYNATELTWVAV
ncbi:MAG: hypothetical protein M3Q28_00705 [Pseudomonadota bacterium]|nr:hypothetical protein [Pseudomonadota bacterium]